MPVTSCSGCPPRSQCRLCQALDKRFADRLAKRDHAKACAFSLAEELAGEEITRLKALLSRARDALEPLGAVVTCLEHWTDEEKAMPVVTIGAIRTAREVAAEITKELGT